MNKWYMKHFRRVLNVTALNSLIIHRKNIGCKVDHLKFRIDLTEKLSSIQCSLKCHGDDSTAKRLMEWSFTRSIPPTEKYLSQQDGVWSAASTMREDRLYTIVRTAMFFCAWMSVSRLNTQKIFLW
jgi:hypothetical protein